MWEDGWQPSLQMICRRYLNYELDDTFQMTNWRQRPMPEEMLQYAGGQAPRRPLATKTSGARRERSGARANWRHKNKNENDNNDNNGHKDNDNNKTTW